MKITMMFRSKKANQPDISKLKSINEKIIAENELLRNANVNLQAQIDALQEQYLKALEKIKWLEEQYKLGQNRQFGKQSETSHSLNLSLFDDNEADEVIEAVEPIDDETEQVTYSRKKRKGSKRKIDTSRLPKETVVHDLSEEEKRCADCAAEMHQIGEDRSEKIDFIPAQLKVIEHITPQYACKACATMKAAKKPESPIQKSMATTHLIVDVILKKYDEHLPLYRQSKILERDGIIIPDNTLGNWVMGAAEVLSPLGEALWSQVAASSYVQADETTVKILYPDKKGYMWVYQGLDPGNCFVMFEFALIRSGKIPENRLHSFSGLLQTDGYSGYTKLGKQENITHLGCWDHARRKFVDADKVCANKGKGIASEFIKSIAKLYKIEREIKQASDGKRYQARQDRSQAILDKLFQKAKKINAPPKSSLGIAITYLKNNEQELRNYINYGKAHISNCLTENIIRPFALGRKNWLFVGNEASANRSGLLYSLIQTCKINKVNVRKYLTHVLNQAHAMRRGEVDPITLLPQFIDPEILE